MQPRFIFHEVEVRLTVAWINFQLVVHPRFNEMSRSEKNITTELHMVKFVKVVNTNKTYIYKKQQPTFVAKMVSRGHDLLLGNIWCAPVGGSKQEAYKKKITEEKRNIVKC